jgi:hypothetical protein
VLTIFSGILSRPGKPDDEPQNPTATEAAAMGADLKDPGVYASPSEDEQALTRVVDWSPEEEAKAKRK